MTLLLRLLARARGLICDVRQCPVIRCRCLWSKSCWVK